MSKRTRTISWCEGKIIETLSKQQRNPTNVIRDIGSQEEEQNLDIAYVNLLSKRQISKSRDNAGMIVYKLVA